MNLREHGRPTNVDRRSYRLTSSESKEVGMHSWESDQLIVLGAGERPVHGEATDKLEVYSMATRTLFNEGGLHYAKKGIETS